MRVRITVEVTDDGQGYIPSNQYQKDLDRVTRACVTGVVEAFRGRVDQILDGHGGIDMLRAIQKHKTFTIADEERKVE